MQNRPDQAPHHALTRRVAYGPLPGLSYSGKAKTDTVVSFFASRLSKNFADMCLIIHRCSARTLDCVARFIGTGFYQYDEGGCGWWVGVGGRSRCSSRT